MTKPTTDTKMRASVVSFEKEEEQVSPNILLNGIDMTAGAKMTFTFNDGLVVQLLPNGDCLQKIIDSKQPPKEASKGNNLVYDQPNDSEVELQRLITTDGEVIKFMADGNTIIYFSDGSIT